ncbi:MAG: hypothetical protein P8Y64_02235 [Gammaproteobacteria bacterium]|jgi:hypothetical protein
MEDSALKIPKLRKPVRLWIHPEGAVVGHIFLQERSDYHEGAEDPIEVLNNDAPFLVMHVTAEDEFRFYNKNSIVRAEFEEEPPPESPGMTVISCRAQLMDGSLIKGEIREFLPPNHQRLYDYINILDHRFLRLYTANNQVVLIHKSYIVRITPLDEPSSGD